MTADSPVTLRSLPELADTHFHSPGHTLPQTASTATIENELSIIHINTIRFSVFIFFVTFYSSLKWESITCSRKKLYKPLRKAKLKTEASRGGGISTQHSKVRGRQVSVNTEVFPGYLRLHRKAMSFGRKRKTAP